MSLCSVRNIKRFVLNRFDKFFRYYLKKEEIKKFRDPRRVAIHSTVSLTDEQKNAIDKVYLENYGKKIPHTWHKHFTAYTGKFDPYYFPELLFIPAFEKFMNNNASYATAFSDKAVLPLVASSEQVDIKMPRILISSACNLFRNQDNTILSREEAIEIMSSLGEVFVKPSTDSSSGKKCMKLNMNNGIDELTGRTAEEIFVELGSNFVVQECIKCHSSIRAVYPDSVNTFRIITYVWRDNVEHMPIIMRIGQKGAYVDNAHAGGMFIAVSDDGTLHQKAFTEFKKEFVQHPDTGLVFEGHRIENMADVIAAAKRIHQAIPQIGCVNWDFTIDEEGAPVLIEANINGGSIWMAEMAHGCGVFGERTPEVLQWVRSCESIPKTERYKYAYGRITPKGEIKS